MIDVETQCLKQNGICADCTVNFTIEEESYGLACHKCNKLYCSRCYSRVHAKHNLEMWAED